MRHRIAATHGRRGDCRAASNEPRLTIIAGFQRRNVGKVKFQTQKTPVFRPGSLLSMPNQPEVAFGVSRRSVVLETDMAQRTGLEPATPGVTGRYSNRLNYRCVSLWTCVQLTRLIQPLGFGSRTRRTCFGKYGAADGTRTRDPRRDRPVF